VRGEEGERVERWKCYTGEDVGVGVRSSILQSNAELGNAGTILMYGPYNVSWEKDRTTRLGLRRRKIGNRQQGWSSVFKHPGME
jgi:hypothetical protein